VTRERSRDGATAMTALTDPVIAVALMFGGNTS